MISTRLADLAARYWAFQRDEFPISAIQAGQPGDGMLQLRSNALAARP